MLGKTGRNFAAGMSGGVAYVYNIDEDFDYYCNMQMVELTLIEDTYDSRELRQLITNHYNYTNSPLAKYILDNWNTEVEKFMKVTPIEYKKVLQEEQMRKLQEKIEGMQKDY